MAARREDGGKGQTNKGESMAVKRGNRTKRTVKNRSKVKRIAAKRKKVRHQKSVKRGMRAR
jgi:hypothetical protein